jgi:hypothetical protein
MSGIEIVGNEGIDGRGGITGITIANLGIGMGGRLRAGISKFNVGIYGIGIVGNEGIDGRGGITGITIANLGIGSGGTQDGSEGSVAMV